jgi:PhnB protein
MTTINPYLTFNGNCLEAFTFYKSVFGGEFPFVGKFKDMPASSDFAIAEKDREKIMHISLPISEETVLMGSDFIENGNSYFVEGNNYTISINTKSIDEADRLFDSLSIGGIVTMPLNKTFWESYFGMFTDKFGINWMVSCALEGHKNYEK